MIRKVVCHKALKICDLWSDIFTNNSLYHPFWEIVRVSAISFFVIYFGKCKQSTAAFGYWGDYNKYVKKKENDFSLSGEVKDCIQFKKQRGVC